MKTPEEQFEAVKSALGLVEDGDVTAAMAKLEELLEALKEQEPTPAKQTAAALAAQSRKLRSGGRTFETPHGLITLTARELKTCKETGAKPEVYAANKARKEVAKRGGRMVSR